MNALFKIMTGLTVAYLFVVVVLVFKQGFLVWDQQQGLSFTQNQTYLAYNITAIAQSDSNGNGPAYLLNGLSNRGYWYQIGIAYNWSNAYSYTKGFSGVYEVFDPNGVSIYPGNGGGELNLTGQVNPGDKILLKMYFYLDTVEMTIIDWNTGARGNAYYSAETATKFIGSPSNAIINGTFSGLMTEWYHIYPNYNNGARVSYAPATSISGPAWFFADEQVKFLGRYYFRISNRTSISPVSPYQNSKFSLNNITEGYLPNSTFITGGN